MATKRCTHTAGICDRLVCDRDARDREYERATRTPHGRTEASTDARVIERYATWREARERMSALRLAGFHAQATDMGDQIHVIIDGGPKKTPLSRLPEVTG